MQPNVLVLLPDFALIASGAVFARTLIRDQAFWSGAEKLVYYVLFPPLLFMAIATSPSHLVDSLDFALIGFGTFAVGILLSLLAAPLLRPEPVIFASVTQTGFRFNSYIGLAIAASLFGSPGVALLAVLISICVPVANIVAVLLLARLQPGNLKALGRELISNPLIVATLAGLAANASGLVVPELLALYLNRLGGASLAIGLICVGAGLRLSSDHARSPALHYYVVVKLLAAPVVALLAIHLLQLKPLEANVLLLFAALPTATTAYILAVRMGGNGPAVAYVITLQTLLAMVTLPLWLSFALSR